MPAAALDASAPGMPRSTTVPPTPRWASRSATADPMMPPPMIATSVVSTAIVRCSDSVRRRAGPLQLAFQGLRHPYLILRVNDQSGAIGIRRDQSEPFG